MYIYSIYIYTQYSTDTIYVCIYSMYIGIYTVQYYSAIKKNEIMPFAMTWMVAEIIIPSETERRKI